MASVHRQPGSPYYFAFYRIPQERTEDGRIRWKLVKRSTKKEKRDDAMVEAKKFEILALEEQGTTDEKGRKYVQILREAVEDAAGGLLNIRTATDHLQRLTEAATGKPLNSYTIESWLWFWLDSKASAKRSNGTLARYKGVIDDFLNSLPETRRSAALGTIGMDDIVPFQRASSCDGKASATVNLAVKTLSMAFKRATELGHLKLNPAKGFDRVPKGEKFTKGVFSPEQVAKLVSEAESDWKGLILFGFFTGMRLRDITNLKWNNLSRNHAAVTFNAAKTGEEVIIPTHPRLVSYLSLLGKPKNTNSPIFPAVFGMATSGSSGLSMMFARIMARAGVVGKKIDAQGNKGRARNSLSFHSLRHSFTSSLANAGVSPEVRQKLTGHRDAKIHQIYTHQEMDKLKDAIDLLPSI
ncbi:MAG: integrase family protein [Verrucomicrobiaceae bacterium]|nr:integrase family protein [Verrucomicrobiaceae bacterium]